MNAADVIRGARRRAGLSQAQLAARLGTKQPVVARWESGARSPSFDVVVAACRACDLTLEVAVADPGEDASIRSRLRLSPAERLRRNAETLETERWAARARRVDARR